MTVAGVCVRCLQECAPGLIFCDACAPPSAYRQSATVYVGEPVGLQDVVEARLTAPHGDSVTVSPSEGSGPPAGMRHPHDGYVRVKGRVSEPGRRPRIEVTQQFGRWNHDRQRPEDVTTYVNRETDEYWEVWTLPGTAEITWEQREPLSQHRHGNPRSGGKPTG